MLKFKLWIYKILVNRKPGISYRYHQYHDGSVGIHKIISWIYLLWINFCYYILFCHFLGNIPDSPIYEQHYLNLKKSESMEYIEKKHLSVEQFVEKIKDYDVISFDVFDTLIFRPVSIAADLFYLIGTSCCTLNFKNIRVWAEWDARIKRNEKYGDMEVDLGEIWKNLEEDTGLDAIWGQKKEIEIEKQLCYANPFMLEVWKRLIDMKKNIIIVSDMYLSKETIEEILHKAGYRGEKKIYVSSEYRLNKASGRLFHQVIEDLYNVDTDKVRVFSGRNLLEKKKNIKLNKYSMVHIGDNPHSDQSMPLGYGIDVLPYQNVNINVAVYRPMDMSYIIGSAYRAIVSNHIYNGLKKYSMEYEYGYIYGGLFVVGYCRFIHEYYKKQQLDKVLFLSRDGDILKKVYNKMYPEDNTEYVYWSRKAATILMANEDKHDYFRRFIYHKVNQDYTISDILNSMQLQELIGQLSDWKNIWLEKEKEQEKNSYILAYKQLRKSDFSEEKQRTIKEKIEYNFSENQLEKLRKEHFIDLKPEDKLTDKNSFLLRRFIEAKWEFVINKYDEQMRSAEKYYKDVLRKCSKVTAVDIGWAGSGACALSHLVENVWKIPCKLTGIIAGTNTIYNYEPDASEPFLQNEKLVAYLYSQQHNRDLLKKHNPDKEYNVYWELLLSSPTPHFEGFYSGKKGEKDMYISELDISLKFGKYDENLEGIKDIQNGIADFSNEYIECFKNFPYMFNISGRDAYAPMLVAASHNERYLKKIGEKFALEVNVN